MGKRANDVVIVGVALFAMFFGAGNLIFPPFMGLTAGGVWSIALIGFLITGIGMPLLGIMASARAGGSVEHLAGRVGPLFATVLSVVIILAIGPLLAIPRTCATAYELGVRPASPEFSRAFFSVIYFGLTLAFVFNRSAVVDKIGKFLTPFLVVTLGWIILRGVFYPMGPVAEQALATPFASGFREGYQTMDALASVVFATIVIGALTFKGYKSTADQVKLTSLAGLIAATGLGLVYGGLMYLGATAAALYPPDVERTTLLIGIANTLLGGGGQLALGLAVGLACLTTSIGLTATVGEYFSRLSGGRIGYRTICVATAVFSGVFATVGVTTIVTVAVPLLVTVYPIVIVLIVLTMLHPLVVPRAIYIGGVAGAFATSIFEAFAAAGFPIAVANDVIAGIPLAAHGFAWIVPALLGMAVGAIFAVAGYGRGQTHPAPAAATSHRQARR
jgi:branched-chain amino acid:cation transporter, LIVCS family